MDRRAASFVRFAWVALGVTVLVIVWGAVVRATGSGAGCGSHWPLCNGVVVPLAPSVSTTIEYVHRVTSGLAMILAVGLVAGAVRVFPRGHRTRAWATATLVFMLVEAGIGAGLVLLGLVEGNASALRAGYITVHLVNTMLLVAAMTGTIWWASRPDAAGAAAAASTSRRLTITLLLMLVVAASGAIVALGDTLFPHASLAEGIAADFDPTSHFLIRLRIWHPVLAVALALLVLAQVRLDPAFQGDDRARSRALVAGLVIAQSALGVINLAMLAPLVLQMAHLLVSSLLWIALVWIWMEKGAPNPER